MHRGIIDCPTRLTRTAARPILGLLLASGAHGATAQTVAVDRSAGFPAKPVRIVVASTAGGGADFVARVLAGRLTEPFGQQVVVDNRPGGGSTIVPGYVVTRWHALLARKGLPRPMLNFINAETNTQWRQVIQRAGAEANSMHAASCVVPSIAKRTSNRD